MSIIWNVGGPHGALGEGVVSVALGNPVDIQPTIQEDVKVTDRRREGEQESITVENHDFYNGRICAQIT